ncbi:hypothetical protein Dimus_036708 [Dionaea muscipula]
MARVDLASPRRRYSLVGDVLTQPRRHRSFVEDCRRHLRAAHTSMMWTFDSPRHRELRVKTVVERVLQEGLSSPMEEFRPDLSGSGEDLIPLVANQPDLVSNLEGLTPIMEVAMLEGFSEVDREGGVALDSSPVGLRTSAMVDVDGVMMVDVGLPASIDADDDSLVEEVREDGFADAGELLIIRNPVRCSSILSVSLPYSVANKPLAEEGALLRDAATGDVDLGVVVSKLGNCPMASVSFFPETSALFVADACLASAWSSLLFFVTEDKSLAGVSGLKGDITEDRGRGAVVGMSPVVLDDSSVDRVFQVHSVSPFADNVIDSICPLYDVVGSVEGGRMFSDNGGLVSEVVLVTPAAIAALRPQPTDGLRQPPLSPMEPAMVARSGPRVLSAVGVSRERLLKPSSRPLFLPLIGLAPGVPQTGVCPCGMIRGGRRVRAGGGGFLYGVVGVSR